MTKIYLLTMPFDEEAKTGDGQYASSLELGFIRHYNDILCKWLKRANNDYVVPYPEETTSIPEQVIPSAWVLQPVANEHTVISGYKLNEESSSLTEVKDVVCKTVSPRSPKIIVNHDDTLHSLTIMDIYSQKVIYFEKSDVKQIIIFLNEKKVKLEQAKAALTIDIANANYKKPPKVPAQLIHLKKFYKDHGFSQDFSLNEYIEYYFKNNNFCNRHTKAVQIFTQLNEYFLTPVKLYELEKFCDKLTGIKEYSYDFQNKQLPYDLENDKSFKELYDLETLKDSAQDILSQLTGLDGDILLADNPLNIIENMSPEVRTQALEYYNELVRKLSQKRDQIFNETELSELISLLQNVTIFNQKFNSSITIYLPTFYSKKKFTAKEGFYLANKANQNDPLKRQLINSLITSMQPIDEDTYLDIHIRPPDCGVYITSSDIELLQQAGIKVNVTIHEYKQNYTRRYLQQYTHELMRQANTVQFFNETDQHSAILAASYGDCDKRNTIEPSGIEKKAREVGALVELEKYPVTPYELQNKSKLTVASQQLTTLPDHPKDVVIKPPNILSFGTIRPGKGFEEALKLAQIIKRNTGTIFDKIHRIPIVKIAGDPQDHQLMQQLIEERFGKERCSAYQRNNPYNKEFTSSENRNYWKTLVFNLNQQCPKKSLLNNPFIEIYPWCEPHELLSLKKNSKYVFRMDDMGMRNNGSAILSVLDVGIVYTKFGVVTDDIYIEAKNGKHAKAVDIGKERYGKHSLILKAKQKEPPLLDKPDSPYKRLNGSRDSEEILDSILAREENQMMNADNIEQSENYQTILEAQKLLKTRFTLKNSVEHLLENIGLEDLIKLSEADEQLDPVAVQLDTLDELPELPVFPLARSHTWPHPVSKINIFNDNRPKFDQKLNDEQKDDIIFTSIKSSI